MTTPPWVEKALTEMEANARRFEHNAQSYYEAARKEPRISVGKDGITHPRRRMLNLSNTFAEIAKNIRADIRIVEKHRHG